MDGQMDFKYECSETSLKHFAQFPFVTWWNFNFSLVYIPRINKLQDELFSLSNVFSKRNSSFVCEFRVNPHSALASPIITAQLKLSLSKREMFGYQTPSSLVCLFCTFGQPYQMTQRQNDCACSAIFAVSSRAVDQICLARACVPRLLSGLGP